MFWLLSILLELSVTDLPGLVLCSFLTVIVNISQNIILHPSCPFTYHERLSLRSLNSHSFVVTFIESDISRHFTTSKITRVFKTKPRELKASISAIGWPWTHNPRQYKSALHNEDCPSRIFHNTSVSRQCLNFSVQKALRDLKNCKCSSSSLLLLPKVWPLSESQSRPWRWNLHSFTELLEHKWNKMQNHMLLVEYSGSASC